VNEWQGETETGDLIVEFSMKVVIFKIPSRSKMGGSHAKTAASIPAPRAKSASRASNGSPFGAPYGGTCNRALSKVCHGRFGSPTTDSTSIFAVLYNVFSSCLFKSYGWVLLP